MQNVQDSERCPAKGIQRSYRKRPALPLTQSLLLPGSAARSQAGSGLLTSDHSDRASSGREGVTVGATLQSRRCRVVGIQILRFLLRSRFHPAKSPVRPEQFVRARFRARPFAASFPRVSRSWLPPSAIECWQPKRHFQERPEQPLSDL
jgi:hypothetical protein